MSDPAVQVLTTANIDAVLTRATKPVVVKFWADWCVPCKTLAPQFAALANDPEITAEFDLYAVDVDAHPLIGGRFQVMGLPVVLVLEPKTGFSLAEFRGTVPIRKVRAALENLASATVR